MIALGADIGLATFGWGASRLGRGEELEQVLALGVIVTKKGKGQGVLVTDDLHRRGQEIARALVEVLDLYRPDVVCAESISYPRNAASAAQIGRAWGIVDAELERRGIPLISASPQAIKKTNTGKATASKAEMLDALDERYSGRVRQLLRPYRAKTLHEHPVDALGAIVACLAHPHLRLARSARQLSITEAAQ